MEILDNDKLKTDDRAGLNDTEKSQLVSLLQRAKNTDIRGPVWHELIKIFPTVALELIIFDEQDRVLLVYRSDNEFEDCWHIPGSVWNDWETLPVRLEKLIAREIVKDAGIEITPPQPIGWLGAYRGNDKEGPFSNPTRNNCSLLYMARLKGTFLPKEGVEFFALPELPENTLVFHKYTLMRVKEYLKTGIFLSSQ